MAEVDDDDEEDYDEQDRANATELSAMERQVPAVPRRRAHPSSLSAPTITHLFNTLHHRHAARSYGK